MSDRYTAEVLISYEKTIANMTQFNENLKAQKTHLEELQTLTKNSGIDVLSKQLSKLKAELGPVIALHEAHNRVLTKAEKASESLNRQYVKNYAAIKKHTDGIETLKTMLDLGVISDKKFTASTRELDKQLAISNNTMTASEKTISSLRTKLIEGAGAVELYKTKMSQLSILTKAGAITDKERKATIKALKEEFGSATTKIGKMAEAEKKATQAMKGATAANRELLSKYDQGTSAVKKRSMAIKELAALQKSGIITDQRAIELLRRFTLANNEATQAVKKLNAWMRTKQATVKTLHVLWKGFFAVMAVQTLSRWTIGFAKIGENIELMSRKLQIFTGDTQALEKVSEVALRVGIDFETLNKAMTRFSITTRGAFTTDEMVKWTESLVKAGRITGSTTQELKSGLLQLSQAMSAGRLMGDEYRSISENMPLLKQAIEDVFDSMGRGNEDLKTLSRNGEITADILVQSFGMLDKNLQKYGNSWDTIDAAIERVLVQYQLFVAQLTKGNSVFKDFVNGIAGFMGYVREGMFGKLTSEQEGLILSGKALNETISETQKGLTDYKNKFSESSDEISRAESYLASFVVGLIGAEDAMADGVVEANKFSFEVDALNKVFETLGKVLPALIAIGFADWLLRGTILTRGFSVALKALSVSISLVFLPFQMLIAKFASSIAIYSIATKKVSILYSSIYALGKAFRFLIPLLIGTKLGLLGIGVAAFSVGWNIASYVAEMMNAKDISEESAHVFGFTTEKLEELNEAFETLQAFDALQNLKATSEEVARNETVYDGLVGAMKDAVEQMKAKEIGIEEMNSKISIWNEMLGSAKEALVSLNQILELSGTAYVNAASKIDKLNQEYSTFIYNMQKSNMSSNDKKFAEGLQNLIVITNNLSAAKEDQKVIDEKMRTGLELLIKTYVKISKGSEEYNKNLKKAQSNDKKFTEGLQNLIATTNNLSAAKEDQKVIDEKMRTGLELLIKTYVKTSKGTEEYNKNLKKAQSIKKGLLTVSEKYKRDIEEAINLNKLGLLTEIELTKRKNMLTEAYLKQTKSIKGLNEELKALAKTHKLQEDSAKFSLRHLKESNPLLETYIMKHIKLGNALEIGKIKQEEYNTQTERINTIFKELNTKELEDNLIALREEYSGVFSAQQDFNVAQASVNKLLKLGLMSAGEAASVMRNYARSLLEAQAAAGDLGAAIKLMWEEFKVGVDENVKGLFSDVLKGEADAWDNFTDRLFDSFADMLADMAYELLRSAVWDFLTGNFSSGLTGLFGGLVSGFASLFGGGSSSNSIVNTAQTASSVYSAGTGAVGIAGAYESWMASEKSLVDLTTATLKDYFTSTNSITESAIQAAGGLAEVSSAASNTSVYLEAMSDTAAGAPTPLSLSNGYNNIIGNLNPGSGATASVTIPMDAPINESVSNTFGSLTDGIIEVAGDAFKGATNVVNNAVKAIQSQYSSFNFAVEGYAIQAYQAAYQAITGSVATTQAASKAVSAISTGFSAFMVVAGFIMNSGLVKGKTKPEISLQSSPSGGQEGIWETSSKDAKGYIDSLFGGVSFKSQHDYFIEGIEQFESFTATFKLRLNGLDDAIADFVGKDMTGKLIKHMESFNIDIHDYQGFEAPDVFMLQRYDEIANQIGETFNEGFDIAIGLMGRNAARTIKDVVLDYSSDIPSEVSVDRERYPFGNAKFGNAEEAVYAAVLYSEANEELRDIYKELSTITTTVIDATREFYMSGDGNIEPIITEGSSTSSQLIDSKSWITIMDYFNDASEASINTLKDMMTKSQDWIDSILPPIQSATAKLVASGDDPLQRYEEDLNKPPTNYSEAQNFNELVNGVNSFNYSIDTFSASIADVILDFIKMDKAMEAAGLTTEEFSEESIKAYSEFEQWAGGLEQAVEKIGQLKFVNLVLSSVSVSLFDMSIEGVKAADALVQVYEGFEEGKTAFESFNGAMANFLDNFGTDSEKLKFLTDSYAVSIQSLNQEFGQTLGTNAFHYADWIKTEIGNSEVDPKLKQGMLSLTNLAASIVNFKEGADEADTELEKLNDSMATFTKTIADSKFALNDGSAKEKATSELQTAIDEAGLKADASTYSVENLTGWLDYLSTVTGLNAEQYEKSAEETSNLVNTFINLRDVTKDINENTADFTNSLRELGMNDSEIKNKDVKEAFNKVESFDLGFATDDPAMMKFSKFLVDNMDSLDVFSDRLGFLGFTANMSVDEIITFTNALINSGVNIDDSIEHIFNWANSIKDTNENISDSIDSLRELGMTASEIETKNMKELFDEVAGLGLTMVGPKKELHAFAQWAISMGAILPSMNDEFEQLGFTADMTVDEIIDFTNALIKSGVNIDDSIDSILDWASAIKSATESMADAIASIKQDSRDLAERFNEDLELTNIVSDWNTGLTGINNWITSLGGSKEDTDTLLLKGDNMYELNDSIAHFTDVIADNIDAVIYATGLTEKEISEWSNNFKNDFITDSDRIMELKEIDEFNISTADTDTDSGSSIDDEIAKLAEAILNFRNTIEDLQFSLTDATAQETAIRELQKSIDLLGIEADAASYSLDDLNSYLISIYDTSDLSSEGMNNLTEESKTLVSSFLELQEVIEDISEATLNFNNTISDLQYNITIPTDEDSALRDLQKSINDLGIDALAATFSLDDLNYFLISIANTSGLTAEGYNELSGKTKALVDDFLSLDVVITSIYESIKDFSSSMEDLTYTLRDESELKSTITSINDLMEELGIVGNHVDYTKNDFIDFIATLDSMDSDTRDAKESIEKLGSAMMNLNDIIKNTQSDIDEILLDMQMRSIDEQISAEQELLELQKESNDLEIERYDATIRANETLLDFLDSLKISDLNNQSPLEQMNEAAQLFNDAVLEGNASDATSYASDYLGFAQDYYASTKDYSNIFDSVVESLDGMIKDAGLDPSENDYTTSDTLAGLEAQKVKLEDQLNVAALKQQSTELISAFNDLALAKDTTIVDIAEQNGIDLLNYTDEIGSLWKELSQQSQLSFYDLGVSTGVSSTTLANQMGIAYTTLLDGITGGSSGKTLLDIYNNDVYTGDMINAILLTLLKKEDMPDRRTREDTALDNEMDRSELVNYIYNQILKKPEDLAGMDYWTNDSATAYDDLYSTINKISKPDTTSQIDFNDTLTRAELVEEIYTQLLQKPWDTAGMDYWTNISQTPYDDLYATIKEAAGYKMGTNFVPEDQYAYLHKGEAVIPEKYNRQLSNYGVSTNPVQSNDEIITELKELKEELRQIKNVNSFGFKETIKYEKKSATIAKENSERERVK